ncbi:MAG TPA: MaoC family dehydratase [Solirubrobacterales bacterium]|nr:MaoC family dehydratase [Solirubrobacterales bacterium]
MSVAVTVGARLPSFVVEAVDPGRMATMAALLDDPTPIHLDRVEAARQGFGERRVNQGPMAIGYALEMLRRWSGDPDPATRLRIRFLDNVFEGERLTCDGEVVTVDPKAGTCTIEFVVTSGERKVAAGSATVRLSGSRR